MTANTPAEVLRQAREALALNADIDPQATIVERLAKTRAVLAAIDALPSAPAWPCHCDERGIGKPGVTCGDCPRDYGHAVSSAPSGEPAATLYVEARECSDCGHVGINDDDGTAACNRCEWHGPSPTEDHCPGCDSNGTMTTACPECGHRTTLLASAHVPVPDRATTAPAPLPATLLVRDIANDLKVSALDVCSALWQLGHGPHSVNMAITADMVRDLTKHFGAAPLLSNGPETGATASVAGPADHVPAGPEAEAATDAKLGMVLLPPIRVSAHAHAILKRIAEARGMVLQAVVREALEPAETMGVAPQAAPVPAPSDDLERMTERRDELRRALEIIAVGDASNPQQQAAEELIALGYWRDIPEARASSPAAAAPEPVGHWDVARIMELASEYARLSAKAHAERLYGTSASYTAQCTKRENEAHAALFRALSAHPAPAVAATVQAAPAPQAATAPAAAAAPEPTDPLHDDAYLRGIALGFPAGDHRRWTLCRIADRVEAAQAAANSQAILDGSTAVATTVRGLTDAQFRAIYAEAHDLGPDPYVSQEDMAFGRGIEAAHGIATPAPKEQQP